MADQDHDAKKAEQEARKQEQMDKRNTAADERARRKQEQMDKSP